MLGKEVERGAALCASGHYVGACVGLGLGLPLVGLG